MMRQSWQFDEGQIDNLLLNLNNMALQTKPFGDVKQECRFYHTKGQHSYFFGLYPFDLNRNVRAVAFLHAIGFSRHDVDDLKQAGGLPEERIKKLNKKLKAALIKTSKKGELHRHPVLLGFYAAQGRALLKRLQTALGAIGAARLDIAEQVFGSLELQLRLLHYMNRHDLKPEDALVQWLNGQPITHVTQLPDEHILTGADIRHFIMEMQAIEHNGDDQMLRETARLDALDTFIDDLIRRASVQCEPVDPPVSPAPPPPKAAKATRRKRQDKPVANE